MSVTFTSFLNAIRGIGHQANDDGVDTLHYHLNSNTLILLAVIVSWKQFGGTPMEYMVPAMFPSSYVEETYFVPFSEEVPVDVESRREKRISYYQWVPFFLLFQALCFRLPSIYWRYLSGQSGIRLHEIVGLASDSQNVQPDTKAANLKALTVHIQNALRFHRRQKRRNLVPYRGLPLSLPYTAFYVTFMYVTTKLLYLCNVTWQFYLLNKFLQTDTNSTYYGYTTIKKILTGQEWEMSGAFPRVTLCDFNVRVMGNNVIKYSIQCVLVINIFNEKIFVFLWFLFTILIILTALSLVYWFFVMVIPGLSMRYISRHLELTEIPFETEGHERELCRFVQKYLRSDGVFVLRMITMHAGVIFGADLVLELWRAYYGLKDSGGDIEQSKESLAPFGPNSSQDDKERRLSFLKFRRPSWKRSQSKDDGGNGNNYMKKDLVEVMLPGGGKGYMIMEPAKMMHEKLDSDQLQERLMRERETTLDFVDALSRQPPATSA